MFKIVLPIALLMSIINFASGGDDSDISIVPLIREFDAAQGLPWDDANNVLYFVDVYNQMIRCWNPATNQLKSAYIANGTVSIVISIEDTEDTFIVTTGKILAIVTWDGKSEVPIEFLQKVEKETTQNRFNDGKVDPKGRLWVGIILANGSEPNQGTLYRFDADTSITKMLSPVINSNGLTWSHNNDTFYYIDGATKKIITFDYDNESGDISNRQVLFDFNDHDIPGIPDGMTIDTEGNLWVAENHGSGKIIRIDAKTVELLRIIEMPTLRLASVAFGGPNKDILYVSSQATGLPAAELKQYPQTSFFVWYLWSGSSWIGNAKF